MEITPPSEENESFKKNLLPGTFVLVNIIFMKTTKHYVACIISPYDDDNVNVKYLRVKGNCFHYPPNDDLDTININKIDKVLPPPEIS